MISEKYIKVIFFVIFLICFLILSVYFNKIEIKLQCTSNERMPIDFELKNLDECYLTIHNLISINSNRENNSTYNSNSKTFVYTSTKPFLIELLNNATKDCICCPNNFNEHLNIN
jgi:hypothetical protein